MFRCPSDILITSWLFTARWSTWPGNHLVPRVAELVGSCIPIHARQCLPDPRCLFYSSGLSLSISVDHFCLVPVDDVFNICHLDGPNRGLLDWRCWPLWCDVFEVGSTDATDAVKCSSCYRELNPLGHWQPVEDLTQLKYVLKYLLLLY